MKKILLTLTLLIVITSFSQSKKEHKLTMAKQPKSIDIFTLQKAERDSINNCTANLDFAKREKLVNMKSLGGFSTNRYSENGSFSPEMNVNVSFDEITKTIFLSSGNEGVFMTLLADHIESYSWMPNDPNVVALAGRFVGKYKGDGFEVIEYVVMMDGHSHSLAIINNKNYDFRLFYNK
jgi:hypothetical protein